MLNSIFIVTLVVMNLAPVEQAWQTDLHYQRVDSGVIETSLAQSWGAPAVAGKRFSLLQPESGEPVYIRLIEDPQAGRVEAMATEGWNAVELLVQDPEVLVRRLSYSDSFQIVGEPRFLTDKHNILALQALGPSRELIYLTRINDPGKSMFDLGFAKSWVDRVFIMVVGGRDLEASRRFYQDVLGMNVTDPIPYRIGVLSKHYGMPDEHLHNLAVVKLPNQFLLELDEYPAAAKKRVVVPGHLPPGVAMVSFKVNAFSTESLRIRAKPLAHEVRPYVGAQSVTVQGPSGELIELVSPD